MRHFADGLNLTPNEIWFGVVLSKAMKPNARASFASATTDPDLLGRLNGLQGYYPRYFGDTDCNKQFKAINRRKDSPMPTYADGAASHHHDRP